MLLLALVSLAVAHSPPGVSTATITPDRLTLVFADVDAHDDATATARFTAASVDVAGSACGRSPPSLRRFEGVVEVSAALYCPPGKRTYRAAFLHRLPPSHRHDVQVSDADGTIATVGVLDRAHPDAEVVGLGVVAVLLQWLRLGAAHIATGWDHLAFVSGLALGGRTARDVIVAATGFTVGHAVTLALGAVGAIVLPAALVETAIAASIAAVAIENLAAPPPPRRRAASAAAFGLLHGLGFAGALRDIGLPVGARILAILGFNVGIEVGQLAFLAALGLGLAAAGGGRQRLVRGGSVLLVGIGLVAALSRLYGGLTDA